jgi:hypothetical protein
VGREGDIQPLTIRPLPINQFSIVHDRELLPHDPFGLVKCCESLAFLIRDVVKNTAQISYRIAMVVWIKRILYHAYRPTAFTLIVCGFLLLQ